MVGGIETRRGTVDDADMMLADVQSGFDSYVAFAPLGWVPPDAMAGRDRTVERLADPGTWAMLALAGRSPVGHVAFVPGRERPAGEPGRADAERALVPGLCHLWQLFVLPEWWGRGVGPLLHDAATGAMRAQRYERARLFTPSLHARARRFYERRGWTVTGEEWNDDLALMLTEYRLVLDLDALALLPAQGAARPPALRPEPEDEGRHPPCPEQLWNESWYFDAVSDSGDLGLYVRTGRLPNEAPASTRPACAGPAGRRSCS